MRWVIVLAIVACGSKDEPKPTADLTTVVAPKPTTVLDEAMREIKSRPSPGAAAHVALAHAMAVAKHPDAKAAIEVALAGAEPPELVRAVEVIELLGDSARAAKLRDEAVAKLTGEQIGVLLSPMVALEDKLTIEALAKKAVAEKDFAEILKRVDGGEAENALVGAARELPEDKRVAPMVALANKLGQRDLIEDAIAIVMKNLDDYDALPVAEVLAHVTRDLDKVKKLTAHAHRQAHSEEAAPRAVTFARLAKIYSIARDAKTAEGYQKKAIIAADAASEDDLNAADVWAPLAVGRALRDDLAGALELVKDLPPDVAGQVAYDIYWHGDNKQAQRIVEALGPEAQFVAIERIVEHEARREIDAAKARVLAARPQKAKLPGAEHVLRAAALQGDIAMVREVADRGGGGLPTLQKDAFLDHAARSLARQGKCVEAVAATKDVKAKRGECLATIARYCPNATM